MKCISCGAELRKGQVFCPSCGKEVQLVSASSVLEDDYLDRFLDEDGSRRNRGSFAGRSEEKKTESMMPGQRKKLIVISLCVMIFVLAVVGFLAWFLVYSSHLNSIDYQMEQGALAWEGGRTEVAVTHYERALKLDKTDVDAYLALGEIYLEQKDYTLAQKMFQEAINLDGKSIDAYKGLFQVFEQQKQYDRIPEAGAAITDSVMREALSDYLVEEPLFSLPDGTYDEEISITLSSPTGQSVYYTTDGTDPVQYGSPYSGTLKFSTDGTFRVSAVCVNSKGIYSMRVQKDYTLDIKAPEKPVVSPEGGDYGALTYISISVPENCTAYYTWDGTDPDTTSSRYTAPFTIPSGANVLSVVLVDNRTGKFSALYRNSYTFYER